MGAINRLQNGDSIFWVITKDVLGDGEHDGYSFAPKIALDKPQVKALLVHKFKLFDDDGILYYEGVATNQDSESAFEPLDWAMANDGCTEIQYYNEDTKEWETL